MRDEQFQAVVELIAGFEAAIVSILDSLHRKGLLSRDEALAALDPERLPPGQQNKYTSLIFRQIADALRQSEELGMSSADRAERNRQLFRVIDTAPPESPPATPEKP